MKKSCSFILVLAVVLSCFPVTVLSAGGTNDDFPVNDNLITIEDYAKCEEVLSYINQVNGLDLEIDAIKPLVDFAGNVYYDIECKPQGYIIMHGQTGDYVEYSENAKSPYDGRYGTLLYGGPTYYYYVENGEYKHTWYEETVTEDDAIQAAESCSIMNNYLLVENKEYVIQNQMELNVVNTYIPKGWILQRLTNEQDAGYMDGDVCGYIASGLLLLWHRFANDCEELVDGLSYLYDDSRKFIDSAFTRKLFSFGDGNLTSGDGLGENVEEAIQDVLSSYGESINVDLYGVLEYWIPTASRIIDFLIAEEEPLIIFGELYKQTVPNESFGHAVLAYAYTSEGNIRVHFGYGTFSDVILRYVSPLGEALSLNYYVHEMSFSDVPTSHWGYPAISYCARHNIIEEEYGSCFGIDEDMSRDVFVNALYHLCGEPTFDRLFTGETNPYEDAWDYLDAHFEDAWETDYPDALAWAHKAGIMNGISQTEIGPKETVTREQAVTFLHRFNNKMKYSFARISNLTNENFSDWDQISDYAEPAMVWAVSNCVISGTDLGEINPTDTMTKAQCAQMIYNLYEYAEFGNTVNGTSVGR